MSRDFEPPVAWLAGDPELSSRLASPTGAGRAEVTPLDSGGVRRRHERLTLAGEESLFLKRFPLDRSRRPRLEGLLRRVGASSAQREWRALVRAHRGGAPVPEPRGLWRSASGDLVIATAFVDGLPLSEALQCAAKQRRALLGELATAVCRFHRAGLVHRDLHAGNVRVSGAGPFLVDLGATLPSRAKAARARDWGELEHSLESQLSTPDRVGLRAAALGLSRPFGVKERAALRALGRAAEWRRRVHMASRTRRAGSPGRRFARLVSGGWRGLHSRSLPAEDVLRALADAQSGGVERGHVEEGGVRSAGESSGEVLKSDGRTRVSAVRVSDRRLIVKSVTARGWLRPLADLLRGSAGRRAWMAGHGLVARGLGVATPLAYLERRVLGVPVASAVLLEDLRPALSAERSSAPVECVSEALTRLLIDLHRAGVHHGDLKASHVLLVEGAGGLEPRLIDLEGVRFRRRLSEAERIRALAELNASLPDVFPNALREASFRRYASALPFGRPVPTIWTEIVERSLARRHRWTGLDQAGVMVAQRK